MSLSRPFPLTTVELQKRAAKSLRISSHDAMKVAESLYNKGLISYPRTETDQFPQGFDFKTLIEQQYNDPQWGDYARGLLERDGFQHPKPGKNNDQSHPPIHPTKFAGGQLNGLESRMYEFVVRHYLACCSKDAHGMETTVHFECIASTEEFTTSGLIIHEFNFLEIYPYIKWSDRDLPPFKEGEKIMPSSVDISEGTTSPPPLLTEADLIKLMDQHGIGTDATIAEHIHKILKRGYVKQSGAQGEFSPTPLGEALVAGYNFIGYRSLNQPELRSKLEQEMKLIGSGDRTKEQVVAAGVNEFKAIFRNVVAHADKLDKALGRYFTDGTSAEAAVNDRPNFSLCGVCGHGLSLRETQMGESSLVCDVCNSAHRLPRGTYTPKNDTCPLCGFGVVEVLSPQKKSYTFCPSCYSKPPAGALGDIESGGFGGGTMPCFMCTADCKYAGKRGGGKVRSCPSCGAGMELKKKKDDGYFIGCSGFSKGTCTKALWLPWNAREMESFKVLSKSCPRCGPSFKLLQIQHTQTSIQQDGLPDSIEVCIGGCQADFREQLTSSNRNFSTWETDNPAPPAPAASSRASSKPVGGSARGSSSSFGSYNRSSFSRTDYDDEGGGRSGSGFGASRHDEGNSDFGFGRSRGGSLSSWGGSSSSSNGSWNKSGRTGTHGDSGGFDRQLPPPKLTEDGTPICECDHPAVQRTAGAQSKNPGKDYWTCADRGCNFFVWVGDEEKPRYERKKDSQGGGSSKGGWGSRGGKTFSKRGGKGKRSFGGRSGGRGTKRTKRGGGDDAEDFGYGGGGYDGGFDDE